MAKTLIDRWAASGSSGRRRHRTVAKLSPRVSQERFLSLMPITGPTSRCIFCHKLSAECVCQCPVCENGRDSCECKIFVPDKAALEVYPGFPPEKESLKQWRFAMRTALSQGGETARQMVIEQHGMPRTNSCVVCTCDTNGGLCGFCNACRNYHFIKTTLLSNREICTDT